MIWWIAFAFWLICAGILLDILGRKILDWIFLAVVVVFCLCLLYFPKGGKK